MSILWSRNQYGLALKQNVFMYLNGKKYRERYLRVKISLKILEDNFDFLLAYHLREKMRGGRMYAHRLELQNTNSCKHAG